MILEVGSLLKPKVINQCDPNNVKKQDNPMIPSPVLKMKSNITRTISRIVKRQGSYYEDKEYICTL